MNDTTTLDDRTAVAIRDAIQAAAGGRLADACAIGESALAAGGDPAALNAMLGMLRQRAGDANAALAHLRLAHCAKPDDVRIALNLATGLIAKNEYREALEVASEPRAQADPSLQLHRLRAFAAQSLEDHEPAIASYEQVVATAPDDWESWNNLGNARRSAGDANGAVAALRRAAELAPDSPPVRLNLALALAAKGEVEEAEKQLLALAADYPSDTKALFELHAIRRELQRDEDALEAIVQAVERDPDNLELLLPLASQYIALLRFDLAEQTYRRARELEPANGLASLGLASVFELTNRTQDLSALVAEAEETSVDPTALNFIRAFDHRRAKRFEAGLQVLADVPDDYETPQRLHLLGQLLEGAGCYDEAFAAFSRMNVAALDDFTRPKERAARHRALVRQQREMVTAEWVQGWLQEPRRDPRPSPVFLVGFPRSGTTLLDTMLLGHPRVEVLEEEPTLRDANLLLPDFSALPSITDERVQAARDAYWRSAASLTPLEPGNLLVDKNPLNMNQLPLIHRLFPNARIILAVRHPCDVVLSCFVTNFRKNDGMASFLSLETAAELYDLSFAYFEQAQQVLQMPVHRVTYEKVVADRETELASLFEFLGLDWDDGVLRHEETAAGRGRIKTASYAQVTEPIYTRSSGRWEKYRRHLEPILTVLRPWIDKFGYSA